MSSKYFGMSIHLAYVAVSIGLLSNLQKHYFHAVFVQEITSQKPTQNAATTQPQVKVAAKELQQKEGNNVQQKKTKGLMMMNVFVTKSKLKSLLHSRLLRRSVQ